MHESFVFDGGVNGVRATDKLAPSEVAAARNVDFGREDGALAVRRGSRRRLQLSGQVRRIWRNLNEPYNYGYSPYYIATSAGVWRWRHGEQPVQLTTTGAEWPAFGSWRQWTLIANGPASQYWMDDGQTLREWVGQAPESPPSVTVTPLQPLDLSAGGWTVVRGDPAGTVPGGVYAVSDEEGVVVVGVATVPQNGNLDNNAGNPIEDYGIHYLDIIIDNPQAVDLIVQEYITTDGTWRAELRPGEDAAAVGEGEDLAEMLDPAQREEAIEALRRNLRAPRAMFPSTPDVWTVWAVPRSQFALANRQAQVTGWSNVTGVRITAIGRGTFTIGFRNLTINGARNYPLNDATVGYSWWETWAQVEDGVIVRESAPSPPSQRMQVQGVRANLSSTSQPTGNYHGYTHRVFYRQGGYMARPHRVGMVPLATTTFTDAMTDVEALLQPEMVTGVHSRSTMPGNITAISEPFYDRIFVAHTNVVMWSEPGRPDLFRTDAWVEVSHKGDEVIALIPWGSVMVVVCRDSVYEIAGTDFGPDGDWRVYRSPCRYGSLSRLVPIRTPYGIPMHTTDGLWFYQPGSGVEQRVEWIDERIGLIWRGEDGNGRLVAYNPGADGRPWAAWMVSRLYMAIQPGNTLYVFDFDTRRISIYTYPFTTTAGMYDMERRLLVGTVDGTVHELEVEETDDQKPDGSVVPVAATVQTRTWTWPGPSRLMNVAVDAKGAVAITAKKAGGATISTLELNHATRQRSTPTLQGAVSDTVLFEMSMTGPATVYGIEWDRFEEPISSRYVRTPYFQPNTEMHYQLARLTVDTLGQPVSVTLHVDGQEVLTRQVQTSGDGPATIPITLSHRGWVAYATLSAASTFRFYALEWDGVPEPPRVTDLTTPLEDFGGEVELKTAEMTMDCLGGTVTAELILDASVVAAYTLTGTGVKGYAFAAPLLPYDGAFNHPFCRTAQIHYYSTTPFKHYKTWYGVVREPSRVRHWRSETMWWDADQEIRAVNWALEGFGQTVTAKVFVNSANVHTFTITASGHVAGVEALPYTITGRSAYVIYTASAPFKPYGTSFHATPLPPAVTRWRSDDRMWPSPSRIRTVMAHVDPLANPSVSAAVVVNGLTVRTFQLTGPRQTFQLGLDLDVAEGTTACVVYTAASPFRVFSTEWHDEPQPFEKQNWSYRFARVGGASQLDILHRWSMRVRADSPTNITLEWYEIGSSTPFHVADFYHPGDGDTHEFWNPFPPGIRVLEVRVDVESSGPIRVYSLNLDVERVGVKGASRVTLQGVPYAG